MNSKTLGQVLGAVGVAILVSSPILLLFGAAGSGFVLWQAIIGLLLIGAFLAFDPGQVGRVISGKGTFFAATAGGLGLLLVAAVAVGNYVAASSFPAQWDLTKNKIFTLAPDTQKTLKGLTQTVHAYAFYTPSDRDYAGVRDLLQRYHDVGGDKFTYQFVDPDKSPAKVREFGIKKDSGPALVVALGKQQDKVQAVSEEGLTNAIVKISHGGEKKIYFTTGHGEADIKDTQATGYSQVVKALANEGIQSDTLNLLDVKEIPKDAEAIVIAGPQKRFLDPEVKLLSDYLKVGGHVAVLLEPQVRSGLSGLMKQYGIQANDDEIIDPLSRLAGTNLDVPVVGNYAQHAITKDFNETTVFPTCRSLTALSDPSAPRPLALATTNPTAWGETDFAQLAQGKASPEGMVRGSLAVAIVASKTLPAGRTDDRSSEIRLAVFGDSEFPDNRWGAIGPGNQDLFMNTVSWMAGDTDRITIRPRSRAASHLTMGQREMTLVQFFSIDVLPVTLLAVGIAIWRVRRSK